MPFKVVLVLKTNNLDSRRGSPWFFIVVDLLKNNSYTTFLGLA